MAHRTDRGPGQASPEHAGHDQLLIARYAAGDVSATESRTASELIAACADCAALAGDLHVLAGAMRAEPAFPRRRGFRLTAEQAAELRPPSLWERVRARRVLQFAWVQPLAGAVAVTGLVMAVATSGVAIPGFGGATGGNRSPLSAAAPATSFAGAGSAVAATPAASVAPALGLAPVPSSVPAAPSALTPGMKAQQVPPTATPQTDMSAATSTAPNPAPAGVVPSPAAAAASPAAAAASPEAATSSPQAVLAGPAATGPTASGERSVAASPGSGTGTGTGAPFWAFWLALAVVGGVVFAAAQRARGWRGT